MSLFAFFRLTLNLHCFSLTQPMIILTRNSSFWYNNNVRWWYPMFCFVWPTVRNTKRFSSLSQTLTRVISHQLICSCHSFSWINSCGNFYIKFTGPCTTTWLCSKYFFSSELNLYWTPQKNWKLNGRLLQLHKIQQTIFVPENKKVEQEGRTVTGCVSADTEALEVGLIFIID